MPPPHPLHRVHAGSMTSEPHLWGHGKFVYSTVNAGDGILRDILQVVDQGPFKANSTNRSSTLSCAWCYIQSQLGIMESPNHPTLMAAGVPAFSAPKGTKLHILDLGTLQCDESWSALRG